MYQKSNQLSSVKPKRKKTNERKQLVKQCDDLVREILKTYPKTCICCWKTYDDDQLQVGHFITRSVYALRWDFRNVARQCSGCNLRHNYDPSRYASYIVTKWGKEVLDELAFGKDRLNKITTVKLRAIKEELSNMLRALS